MADEINSKNVSGIHQHTNRELTVVMPVYNAAKYLKQSIDSILNQTYSDLIFMILNDGSVDDSEEIILSYKDPRIVYIPNDTNIGLVATLNKALELVQTPFFARMDADDIAFPERIQIQMDYLRLHPEIGVCGTYFEQFGVENNVPFLYLNHDHIVGNLLFANGICHPSVIIRTHLLKDNHIYFGGFDYTDHYGFKLIEFEDYGLWHKLKSITKFANIKQVLLKYRREGQNFSVQNAEAIMERKKEFAAHWLKELGIKADEETLETYFNHQLINKKNGKHKMKLLFHYFNALITANERRSIYSESALKDVVDKQRERFFYIISTKSLGLAFRYMYISNTFKLPWLSYALKVFINKKIKKQK